MFCIISWSLDQTKNGFLHFTPTVFYTFPAGSVHLVLVHKKWAHPFHLGCVLHEQFPCSTSGLYNSMPPHFFIPVPLINTEVSVSHRGGFSRWLWLVLSCHFGTRRRGSTHKELTKVARDFQHETNACVPPKLRYAPSVCSGSQSLMC